MSFNDFAVQLYLTILAIAAAPILLSWVLRRIAGKHAASHADRTYQQAEDDQWKADWENEDWWRYWSGRSDYT